MRSAKGRWHMGAEYGTVGEGGYSRIWRGRVESDSRRFEK
jgi:hypothetical protein